MRLQKRLTNGKTVKKRPTRKKRQSLAVHNQPEALARKATRGSGYPQRLRESPFPGTLRPAGAVDDPRPDAAMPSLPGRAIRLLLPLMTKD